MQNHRAAVMRRLSDPDFQATLVNKSIGLVLIMALLVVAFLIHDAYVWANPPKTKIYVFDGKNPPRPVAALDSPIVDDTELLNWTVSSVLAPYNINYHDYREQTAAAARHFSKNGWQSFADSYLKSGNFAEIEKAMLLCYAQQQHAAIVSRTSLVAGALAYEIQFPLTQTCQNTNQQSTQNLIMSATVVRVNDDAFPDGLAIDRLVATAH